MKAETAAAYGAPIASIPALLRRFAAPRHWPLWLLIALMRALSLLPLPVIYAIGQTFGQLAYCLHRRRRAITLRNLGACFPNLPQAEIRRMARRHFRILVTAAFASGIGWWSRPARLMRLSRYRNPEIIERARRDGKNIILLAPHFAGVEFSGIRLSMDAPTLCMYQFHKSPHLEAIIAAGRGRFGAPLYPRTAPAKSMIRALRSGLQFFYSPDQDPGDGAKIFAPFFSVPAATFATLGRFARLTDACVIPCATKMLARGRGYEIIFAPALKNFPSGDDVADATTLNQTVEQMIALMPEQYFWSHRRFKTRPPGELPFYD